jgi:hypothetical protein
LPACPLWQADQPGPYRNCPVTHHASYTTLWDTIHLFQCTGRPRLQQIRGEASPRARFRCAGAVVIDRILPELIRLGFPHPFTLRSSNPAAWGGQGSTVLAMPLYFFRIRNGHFSGASEYGTECADRNAAWKEMTTVCADMASSISRKLAENSEWQMELLDEARQPVFRIRIVAESLDQA